MKKGPTKKSYYTCEGCIYLDGLGFDSRGDSIYACCHPSMIVANNAYIYDIEDTPDWCPVLMKRKKNAISSSEN